jgi:hydroxymethylpyrimidine pyrophosphatase-like HAD family hydrolase
MALRCVYLDLDGTLLGARASLMHDGEGRVTMDGVRAVEACLRAGVEICIFSGRRQAQVLEDARLLGQDSYIFEVGSGLVVGDNDNPEWLTGGLLPDDSGNIHQQIEAAGVPALLLEHYSERLEPHSPWHRDRDVSHLFRGWIDTAEVDNFLEHNGHGDLRIVDNGRIHRRSERLRFEHLHAYHLIPKPASKAAAVARHMSIRGYAREETIACGDSREDLEVAPVVGRFFLMRNAVERNPELEGLALGSQNVTVTAAGHGGGVYEAVVSTLVER